MIRLFKNGKIYLEREKFVNSILVEDNIIKKVGDISELQCLSYDEVIDLEGRTVIPGLNDSHCHISCVGASYVQVDLTKCKSIDEIVETTKKFIKDYPQYCENGIITMGWNHDYFETGEKRILNINDVNRISTEIPIILERVCGHICAVNSKVLEILNIDENTPNPPGGEIGHFSDGSLNGVFSENAVAMIEKAIPDFSKDIKIEFMVKALEYAASVGLTTVQSNDVGGPNMFGDFETIRHIYENKLSKVRFTHQVCLNSKEKIDEFDRGERQLEIYKSDILRYSGIKMFKDGSLGASTALVREGYLEDRHNHGVCAMSDELHEELVQYCTEKGLKVVTHVIGDGAVEKVIDAYEKSFKNGKNELRHGLIHCQLTDMNLLERIAKNDICVYYQPVFLDYDLHIVEKRVGSDLAKTSYAFNTLDKLGAKIAYGTDAPVEDLNPFPSIACAVTRQDKNNYPENGFVPEECVDIYTAIDAYTEGSAYVEFMENKKGRIKEGFFADLTVLDRDIFTIDSKDIRNVKAYMTIIDGEIVYKMK